MFALSLTDQELTEMGYHGFPNQLIDEQITFGHVEMTRRFLKFFIEWLNPVFQVVRIPRPDIEGNFVICLPDGTKQNLSGLKHHERLAYLFHPRRTINPYAHRGRKFLILTGTGKDKTWDDSPWSQDDYELRFSAHPHPICFNSRGQPRDLITSMSQIGDSLDPNMLGL